MDFYTVLQEYYDELFPLQTKCIDFLVGIRNKGIIKYDGICKVLDTCCFTATIDHALVRQNFDVTGIDDKKEMIVIADRRKKIPFSNSRFFEMSLLDISRYFAKDSFDIIFSFLPCCGYLKDRTLVKKFLYDLRIILKDSGIFIAHLFNHDYFIDNKTFEFPPRESPRVKLTRKLVESSKSGIMEYRGTLSFSDNKRKQVTTSFPVCRIKRDEFASYANEAGFSCQFYSDFEFSPVKKDSVCILGILKPI
ncbi:MAG: methyltransferase domain-containing protein [Spirochaetes bacterium]|uniref:Methyltransferase domain-containing protein n=1 Tax=Candidatus Gallitreponema excrementavium TaxID=2840840 RepID=A0A9D9HQN8_9SPIR|nr:methyltransferase domain-containing protein [Candidatus Gallitreponema excrementavium]